MHSTISTNPHSETADKLLIARIQARAPGWKDCFGELVISHQPALYARCLGYLRDPDDAADASQEVLYRAYRAIDTFKGDAAFRTWLFAIANNQCHTLARKRSRLAVNEEFASMARLQEELLQLPPAVDDDPDAGECVHSALRQIPPTGRDVLQLRYFAGLSIEDIAVTLGVGISAAKMRLYRAHDQFASLVDECRLSRAV